MATNQGFKSLVPDARAVEAKYLYWWLKAHRSYLESLGNGATFKEISKAIVSQVEIPLPPLEEQRRVADVLDRADELRAKRRQALAHLDDLTRSTFLDMFGSGYLSKWPTAELQKVVKSGTIVTYGIVQAGEEFAGGVPYIRTGDIIDGEIAVAGLRHTDPEIANRFARSSVSPGDIVMSIRATVGTTALVPAGLDGANLTQGTARISPGGSTNGTYLLHYLRSSAAQHWISRQIKGATFREITLARLRELPVALPPMPLQEEFAQRVKALDELRTLQRTHLAELDGLFASLQDRAFRGLL
ncbi:type I restriction enzyme S subunit [Micromonospora endolithica]|nr:type I restriction enzyme S subunit [Micromonospora endolithica]